VTRHVIQMSGGLGSFWAAVFAVLAYGRENVVLLFADTLWEHPDTYRFLGQASELLDITPIIVCDGRDPFQVYFDQHFLGNSRIAPCTKELKQKPCRRWLEEHCDPADTILYVGLDAAEERRMPGVVKGWAPWRVEFPLMDDKTWDKKRMKTECAKLGIAIPRMYELGFSHNNCQGSCVRAGQAQWLLTLREFPERYALAEHEEQRFREEHGKDVSILTETVDGVKRTLTLRTLRLRAEVGLIRLLASGSVQRRRRKAMQTEPLFEMGCVA
jgi:3'-phosphoadenosine 5'-phosphosulfate sulfotransferase (PAPS reductase)/FAD synthetase